MGALRLILVLSALLAVGHLQCSPQSSAVPQCVSIRGTVCDSYYLYSKFPNFISNDLNSSMQRLAFYINQRIVGDCSLQLYMCLVFMPPCDPSEVPVVGKSPCQSYCEDLKMSCSGISSFLNADPVINCLFADCSSRYPSTDCFTSNSSLTSIQTTTDTPAIFNESVSTCPLPNNTFFSDNSKSFSLGWIIFWSILCFISTLLTLLTFFLDTSRFEYPWRPVVYLALMFNIHSVTYFLSAAMGRGLVTCPGNTFVAVGSSWSWAHTPCLLIFIALYYSMLAAFLWWVVLSTGWFLASAWQWSHEAVSKLAPFFHGICWVLPLLMTVAMLAAQLAGADEATGICFVVRDTSNSSFYGMLVGLIIPLLLLLSVGVVLLVLGFLGVLKVRAHMRQGGKQEEQQILEKLMIRIGIFVAVYIIPATIMIGCYFYELVTRPSWRPLSDNCSSCTRANSAVYMVRVFMFLLIGVMTGTWIWSHKTLQSWVRLVRRCTSSTHHHHTPQKGAELSARASANNAMSHVPANNYSYADSGLESL